MLTGPPTAALLDGDEAAQPAGGEFHAAHGSRRVAGLRACAASKACEARGAVFGHHAAQDAAGGRRRGGNAARGAAPSRPAARSRRNSSSRVERWRKRQQAGVRDRRSRSPDRCARAKRSAPATAARGSARLPVRRSSCHRRSGPMRRASPARGRRSNSPSVRDAHAARGARSSSCGQCRCASGSGASRLASRPGTGDAAVAAPRAPATPLPAAWAPAPAAAAAESAAQRGQQRGQAAEQALAAGQFQQHGIGGFHRHARRERLRAFHQHGQRGGKVAVFRHVIGSPCRWPSCTAAHSSRAIRQCGRHRLMPLRAPAPALRRAGCSGRSRSSRCCLGGFMAGAAPLTQGDRPRPLSNCRRRCVAVRATAMRSTAAVLLRWRRAADGSARPAMRRVSVASARRRNSVMLACSGQAKPMAAGARQQAIAPAPTAIRGVRDDQQAIEPARPRALPGRRKRLEGRRDEGAPARQFRYW